MKPTARVAPRRLHIALVAPVIPWNTGNAGRTCLALGARLHLVEPLGFALDEKNVRRAGLDYWPHVKPSLWPDWATFEAALPKLGEPFFFSAEGARDLWSVAYPQRAVLVFGSETEGLPSALRRRYHARLLALPMPGSAPRPGGVRSLNLSTAVAVAAYEVLRQWGRQAAGGCDRMGAAAPEASSAGASPVKA